MRLYSSFAFLLALSLVLWASDQRAVGVTTVPFLLRMERLRSDQDVCVLVRSDGQYHLERLHPYGIGVFEGKLSDEVLASLESLLMKDGLLRLQQSDIDVPLITGNIDHLFVSILRTDHWQNLEFSSAESRKSEEEFLNPLLKWLEDVQKEKAKELTEESGRSNCLPPKEIQLKMRNDDKISAIHTDASAVGHPYILRTFTRRFDSSRIENSCVIIRDTGVYHVRRSQQLHRKETKTTVLDGTFPAEVINSLRVLIDADQFRKWPEEDPPLARLQASTVTNLTIPRADGVQQISVWRYVFPPAAHNSGSLGSTDLPGMDDHGTKLIKPLDEWMKRNLPVEKEIPTSNPTNPQCLPD
jgi:hypothetical protein